MLGASSDAASLPNAAGVQNALPVQGAAAQHRQRKPSNKLQRRCILAYIAVTLRVCSAAEAWACKVQLLVS